MSLRITFTATPTKVDISSILDRGPRYQLTGETETTAMIEGLAREQSERLLPWLLGDEPMPLAALLPESIYSAFFRVTNIPGGSSRLPLFVTWDLDGYFRMGPLRLQSGQVALSDLGGSVQKLPVRFRPAWVDEDGNPVSPKGAP